MARPAPHRKLSLPTSVAPKDVVRIMGLPAVTAALLRRPKAVERLFFESRHRDCLSTACKDLAARRKPFRQVDNDELTKIAGTPLHGGVVAHTAPIPLLPFDLTLATNLAAPILILDGVGNPHNLGAIIRTMAFFGLPHLILSGHPAQALPSDATYRVAEGGMEWIHVSTAPYLPLFLERLGKTHKVVGTALGSHRPMEQVLTSGAKPLALVLGNEENGLPEETLKACQELARLEGSGHIQSLNVSVTAAILIHQLKHSRG